MLIEQGSILKSPIMFFNSKFLGIKMFLLTLTPFITVIVESKMALIGLGLIIFIDLLTGMRKSLYLKGIKLNPFKENFWRCISSKGMRDTWRKTYEYGIGIIVLLLLQVFFLGDTTVEVLSKSFSPAELGIMVAAVIEIWSIFENIETITGGNPLKKAGGLIGGIKKLWK